MPRCTYDDDDACGLIRYRIGVTREWGFKERGGESL